ncbi:MAG: RlmE family RNA methyltransferase [Gammaproteobacteria bacterium]|nr:RlmE family RNA methyltransferase [Gammaproteobacteria bacterium]
MSKGSKRWLKEHARDAFVKQARRSGFRSRAACKLQELDEREKLLKPGQTVVDLGAAPGSWSQYASRRVGPAGRVVAVDILPMQPVRNVRFIQGDFSDENVFRHCLDALAGTHADLVISDLAPNLSGIRVTDQARSMHLAELVLDFACRTLCKGGDLLIKVFEGAGTEGFRRELARRFQRVTVRKPRASRDASREYYVLARGYKV